MNVKQIESYRKKEEIKTMLRNGITWELIAEVLHCSFSTIAKVSKTVEKEQKELLV
jgi:DNA invertase Pin-like site-specific DNA recombinase